MSIHIGSMLPDRALEESAFFKALTKVTSDLAVFREHRAQKRSPVLDISFLLPGRQEQAGFTGLRLNSFDSPRLILRIDSAVPEKMLTSIHAERYIQAVILDAIEAADEFFREQPILFDTREHLAFMDLLAAAEPTGRQQRMAS